MLTFFALAFFTLDAINAFQMAAAPNLSGVLRAIETAGSLSAAFTREAAWTCLLGSVGNYHAPPPPTKGIYDRIPERLRDQMCGRPSSNFVTRVAEGSFGYLPDSVRTGICPPPALQEPRFLISPARVLLSYFVLLVTALMCVRFFNGLPSNAQDNHDAGIIQDEWRRSWTQVFWDLFVARELPEIVEPTNPTEGNKLDDMKAHYENAKAALGSEILSLRQQIQTQRSQLVNLSASQRAEKRRAADRRQESQENIAQIREEKLELQTLVTQARQFKAALKEAPVWQQDIEQSAFRLSSLASQRYGPISSMDIVVPRARTASIPRADDHQASQALCTQECPGRMQTMDCENGLQRDHNRILMGLVIQKQETIQGQESLISEKDQIIERLTMTQPKTDLEMQSKRLRNVFSQAMNQGSG